MENNPLVMTEADQAQSQSGSELQGNGSQDDPNHKKQPPPNHVKKRTKTGCLTCRKRRIKCDEGRPTCNNCIKSKRLCEGYNQRVVFKDPMGGATYGDPYSSNFHHSGSSHGGHMHAKPPGQGPLPTIAPKPSGLGTQPQVNMQQFGQYSYGHGQPPMPPVYDFNQRPANYPQFAQPAFFIPSQETPNYIQSSPGHAVLGQPPYEASRMSDNSTAYARPPEGPINQPWGEGIEEVVKTEETGYQYDLAEDDASMLESDDETQDPREVLGPVVRRFSGIWDRNGTQVRAFSTFADSNLLSTYTAHAQLRELRDPRMLATFMHFLKVTGPSMSLYERHPFDRGDDENYDTKSNNLWTYTFPLIAFNHPGLLHAILALASLQIAKLQAVPATDAMRHYHIAIRRIAKNIKSPLRRTQPPTLAASLLLAYFEVWSSDHTKWCTHLFGTRILFREIAMSEMTRRCLPVKRMRQMQKDEEELAKMDAFYPGMRKSPRSHLLNLNYNLLSTIFGQTIRPEQYGLGDDQYIDLTHNVPSEKDVEQYETLRDLYWWYCKMDVYQSMLGGTKLFMEYDYWSQCPPRGPISVIDATYGTYDHLMLLLGRLANFSSLDVPRKQRAHRARTQSQDPNSPPSFPGIVPTQGKVDVPLGFTPEGDASSPLSDSDEPDPKASLHAAMQEWESIRQAFDAFKNHLGPEFQPLREEFSDRRDSPFGRTIQYRTFGVAGIWMNFYMGMIHLYRYHPHAPPAAMQAAGQAARQTAEYAIEIGKIAAGLADDCSHETQISTMVSAAFIESCFCLFVAAVQYQDDAQRHWLVRRMYDICRLTGWQTAKQIADGCESGWIKAAQMGRGQPYVRAPDIGADIPHLVKENPRRIDRVIKQELASGERNLVLAKSERAYYALGIIGVEQDMAVLTLKDE